MVAGICASTVPQAKPRNGATVNIVATSKAIPTP